MSIINSAPFFVAKNSRSGAYEIEQSLRFNNPTDAHYLNRTPSTDGNRRTFTYSGWHKFVGMPDASNNRRIFGARSANTDSGWFSFHMRPDTDNRLEVQLWNHSVIVENRIRDFSAWYHLVLAVDTTQATDTNRIKVYINGVQATYITGSGSGISGFSQNLELAINDNASIHNIGTFDNDTNTSLMPMYAAEIYFVDGTQLDETSFGGFDDNGVWRPISVSGLTYGTNGFHLDFSNSSNLGEDQAGSNDWTANNFTTSGTGTDVMSDTPTTNYPTGNPLASNNPSSVSEGNLKFVGDPANIAANGMHTTMGMSSGKWYFEVDINVGGNARTVGILPADAFAKSGKTTTTNYDTYYNNGALSYGGYDGNKIEGFGSSTTSTAYGNSWTTNDVIGVAFDADNGKLFFAKNNTWQNSGDPAAGTNAAFTGISGTYVAHAGGSVGFTATFNFGQRAFTYTPPTGFKALNTSNLPAPEIKDGTKYFNTVLYSGTGTSNSITGVGFSPDFVWLRPRNNADHHRLNTTTQGANRALSSNLQDAEYGPTNAYLDSFDSDGFTVSSNDNGWNNTGYNYVSWNWKEGAIPGFEIVTYTGNGYPTSNTQNISHNLGVAPSFITIKNRSRSSQWLHYVKPLGATKGLEGWHDGDRAYTNANYFNNTEPTSTQFTVGTDSGGNWQGDNFIAYLWAEVDGFFKVGTYERNGSTDGPFIYLGFTPALIIIKEYAAGTEGWPIYDNKRLGYNPNDTPMFINSTNTESYIQTTYPNEIDFLSNGFKIRNNDSRQNSTVSSYRYLYWAWAVNPFGGSGVSPATAR